MKHLDSYEDVYVDMIHTNTFDENSDLSTTYLGQTKGTETQRSKVKKDFPLLDMALRQENYWMGQIAESCWIQVQPSPTCQSLSTCDASVYMHYQNFLPILTGFR